MIDLSSDPFIVTLKDGTVAEDGGDILLLGVSGPEEPHGLILAARELIWHPLDNILIETSLGLYQRVDEPPEVDEAPES